MKKRSNLSQLMGYAGGRKYLTYLSLLLSAVSAVLALFPFVFLFFIIREIIEAAPNYAQATQVVHNGWMAVAFAMASILIYLVALMCSHLSAFRIAGNIRKALMAHIAELPLGFIGEMGSGKIRRIVNDSSAASETYLAHQLPDMAAAITTPICMIVMLFLFGLAVRSGEPYPHHPGLRVHVQNDRPRHGKGYERLYGCLGRHEQRGGGVCTRCPGSQDLRADRPLLQTVQGHH